MKFVTKNADIDVGVFHFPAKSLRSFPFTCTAAANMS